jgi:hypothetical protein
MLAMPKKSYRYQFGRPIQILTSEPLTEEQLASAIAENTDGLTVQLTYQNTGAGYLFHVQKTGAGLALLSYKGDDLSAFTGVAELTRFVNHAAGLLFDEGSWQLSDDLNKRRAPEEGSGEASADEA